MRAAPTSVTTTGCDLLAEIVGLYRVRAILSACWLAGVAGAGVATLWYVKTPGSPGRVQTGWPAAETRSARQPTLVLFAHPKCPCTSVALDALGELLRCPNAPNVTIYFVCPRGTPDGWERGRNWERAHGIGGCRVERDADGRHARSFGVSTSGHALLFTADGSLRYSGGVQGRRLDLAALLSSEGPPIRADVFGCPLFASDTASEDQP